VAAIRMLALDLDGTLAASGDEVSPATRSALHHAQAIGIEIVIATGRRYRTAYRVVESLQLPVPVVCLGGGLIKAASRETLHAIHFEPGDVNTLAHRLHRAGLAPIGQRDSHAHGGADFVVEDATEWNPAIERYVGLNDEYVERSSFAGFVPRSDLLVLGSFGEEKDLAALRDDILEAHGNRFACVIVPSGWPLYSYLEITPVNVSKWTGVLALARQLDIEPEAICAVGDELNDLPMIEGAGLGVAMANGHAQVRAAASWVCGRHDEDGLVEVVDRILESR
jgi:Cof subfamily protein (haloacid dehalogenase superfamily)